MTVEIHEDQPLPEPSTPWNKQLWIPLILDNYGAGDQMNPAEDAFGQFARGTRQLPTDFTAFSTVDLVVYPSVGAAYTIASYIEGGTAGELHNIHNQGANVAQVLVANTLAHIDLTATFAVVLALLQAGDDVMFRFNNQTGNLLYFYGIDVRYT